MNSLVLIIIGLPILEIFVLIKVGNIIGALNTVLLIIFTAITGVYFAKLEGLNSIRSGMSQLLKNEIPLYEMISGATLAFAALLLIFPGFITDIVGFALILPITRKIFINKFLTKFSKKKEENKKIIDGEYEDIKED